MAAVAGCERPGVAQANKSRTLKSAWTRGSPKRKALACWPSTSSGFCSFSNTLAPT